MATKVFNGANVFMSRNLVPPELFDTLHDALKLNGAQVFLCCDPSRNGPNDYHVIASPEHVENFTYQLNWWGRGAGGWFGFKENFNRGCI